MDMRNEATRKFEAWCEAKDKREREKEDLIGGYPLLKFYTDEDCCREADKDLEEYRRWQRRGGDII